MMESVYKRVAVKVGSNVLTRADGTLDVTRMSALVDQIAFLRRSGIEVILISCGFVRSSDANSCSRTSSADCKYRYEKCSEHYYSKNYS